MEPEQPSHDNEHESAHEELPGPTIYPIGFAIGIVVVLVGLVIDPLLISTIGAVIAIIFGFLWARDATAEMRHETVEVEPERRELQEDDPHQVTIAEVPETQVTRSVFLEGATLGLGAAIGGLITIPVAGFAVLPGFLGQELHKVDLGPIERFELNTWYVATFIVDPTQGEVSKRAAFLRNNGPAANGEPSFSIISNRCTHLGCPTQANGPSGFKFTGKKTIKQHTLSGPQEFVPVVPAGYGCPCHGSQFDTEGNRTAGPAPRALDRYAFEINHGRLVLLGTYSVSEVVGTGAQAKIYKYKQAGPGEHINGPEQFLYPLQPPHN